MRITLDHNCIIDLANKTAIGERIRAIVSDPKNLCFVVNIGASEMRRFGVRPDHYEKFEELLVSAGIGHLPRLDPMGIWDVTFWDRCVLADDESSRLADAVNEVLFPAASDVETSSGDLDSPDGRKRLNRLCDVQTLWCHIRSGNDVFLTTDENFSKETKLPKLIALGACRICHPSEL